MKDELKRRVELRFLKKNIRTNRIFILSSMALLVLHRPFHTDIKVMSVGTLLFQMVFTVLIQLAVFSQISFLSDSAKKAPRYVKILAAVSTFGMCCFEAVNGNTLIERFREKLQSLGSRILPGDKIDPCLLLRIGFLLLSVLSAFIVYALTVYIIRMVAERLRELLCSFSQTERKMYAILAVVLIGFVCFSFLKGTAFWGKEPPTDVLFTSDTSNLVRMNAYMSIMHSENDLRQPLFAVFASPFVSIGYAVAFPFSFISPVATPLCMNIVQVLMLVAANLMLAGLLASDSRVRICFVLVFSVTYTSVLFSLMMEQYIVVYFWLIFAIYSAIKKKRADELAVTAAGGTLLTGMALLPLAHDFEEKKDIDLRQMAAEMGKCVALFIVLLLSFGRIDVIMNIFGKTKSLSKFAGGESFWVRIKQYLSFIASCFFAPETKVVHNGFYSLQLSESNYESVSLLGVVILVLCLVSFLLYKKEKLIMISGLWVCFSALILAVVGWGSGENGEILYSLYFGWAFLVLLFRLLERISDKLGSAWVTVAVSGVLAVALLAFNFSAIRDLWSFASVYYPL